MVGNPTAGTIAADHLISEVLARAAYPGKGRFCSEPSSWKLHYNISLSVRAAEGAFLVSPGSHLDGNKSAGWRRTLGATERWLKETAEANAGLQRLVIAPGDAVLFCPSVLHGIDGPRKRSGSRRIARANVLLTGRFRSD